MKSKLIVARAKFESSESVFPVKKLSWPACIIKIETNDLHIKFQSMIVDSKNIVRRSTCKLGIITYRQFEQRKLGRISDFW